MTLWAEECLMREVSAQPGTKMLTPDHYDDLMKVLWECWTSEGIGTELSSKVRSQIVKLAYTPDERRAREKDLLEMNQSEREDYYRRKGWIEPN